MKSIFISHSTTEAILAKNLALWLESLNGANNKCFCTSRKEDIPPGTEWFKEICSNASNAHTCLLLISPFSISSPWLHFEAGITYGAGLRDASIQTGEPKFETRIKQVVPALYAGMKAEHLPTNLAAFEILILPDPDSLSAFVKSHNLHHTNQSSTVLFTDFRHKIGRQADRVLLFGEPAVILGGNVNTNQQAPRTPLSRHETIIQIPRHDGTGEARAIRVNFIPRRHARVPTWKFGITLTDAAPRGQEQRIFEFHAGHHDALDTWTLYYYPSPSASLMRSVDVPAQLGTERVCQLQLWLTPDGCAMCVGVDSVGRVTVVANERGEKIWRLLSNSWKEFRIKAWNNNDCFGQELPFQVDLLSYEVDRVPVSSPDL